MTELRGRDPECPYFGAIAGHVCRRRDGELAREGGSCWTWAHEQAQRSKHAHPSRTP